MKKRFYPLHPLHGFLGTMVLYLFCSGIALTYLVFMSIAVSNGDKSKIYSIVLASVFFLLISGIAIATCVYSVTFCEGAIKTKGQFLIYPEKMRSQDPVTIEISEIANIQYIETHISNPTKMDSRAFLIGTNKFFLFTLKNGAYRWLYITPFSKKQRIQMLALINSQQGTDYSYASLVENKPKVKEEINL